MLHFEFVCRIKYDNDILNLLGIYESEKKQKCAKIVSKIFFSFSNMSAEDFMEEKILEHYRKTGAFTYSGLHAQYFRTLPDDISELGRLVCLQVIHRVTLKEGNKNFNATLLYGDMNRYPWFAPRCHDDLLVTAAAMTAELFRLDELAELLLDPDKNFEKLCNIWETKRKFRMLNSPLVDNYDHGAEYVE